MKPNIVKPLSDPVRKIKFEEFVRTATVKKSKEPNKNKDRKIQKPD